MVVKSVAVAVVPIVESEAPIESKITEMPLMAERIASPIPVISALASHTDLVDANIALDLPVLPEATLPGSYEPAAPISASTYESAAFYRPTQTSTTTRQRDLQEIVSSIQGNFNFLQDSELDTDPSEFLC